MTSKELLAVELQRDEGLRLFAYDDANGDMIERGTIVKGHVTIGYGRALDVNGITAEEAGWLLENDIARTECELLALIPWYTRLDATRQRVLVNMAFNLGPEGLMRFHDVLRYVREARYELAARAMEDSRWYDQVGARAERLVAMMRTGVTA